MSDKTQITVKVLTAKQRKFCHQYVIKNDHIEAALSSYDTTDRHHAAHIGRQLLDNPVILQFIDSIRWEIHSKMQGMPAYCVNKLMEAINIGLQKQQPASVAACVDILNKMYGYGRRVVPFNLAEHDTIDEKLAVVDDAMAQGYINSFEYQVYVQRIRGGDSDRLMGDMQREIKALAKKAEKMTKAPGRCEKAEAPKRRVVV